MQFELYNPNQVLETKYLFFTGKGGVGKTTSACATAIQLADSGRKVILVSTDPASNLQDVFQRQLTNQATAITEVPGLSVANFDPVTAANEYKESVIGPYRGVLPDSAIENMAEQLSGSCTVEIAAFNEFANFLTSPEVAEEYDNIIFDTAPTGHTLRLLQLPSAWSGYLDKNQQGTSCLGQLAGMGDRKAVYEKAMTTLNDAARTTLIMVTRPQLAALSEAERASSELQELGIMNQKLILNGVFEIATDSVSQIFYDQQQTDLEKMPAGLNQLTTYQIPLRAYNIAGIENVRNLLKEKQPLVTIDSDETLKMPEINEMIDDFIKTDKKLIFTMGKGGVGKTTIAIKIATELAKRGKRVHLASTDPADHLSTLISETSQIKLSHIDEAQELQQYQEEVLAAAELKMSQADVDYIAEDLQSPCTQEIAVFRAFAAIVADDDCDVVVIDTAPTGHTLLLLDSSQSYAKEVERTTGDVPESIINLLPKLQDPDQTEVVMVTLPETTPVYESMRLADDLNRAKMAHSWWVVNQSLLATKTDNSILAARATNEIQWINQVKKLSNGQYSVLSWRA
ncbi:arsenical pump-driving ATPase [Latilactobacillus sakei]|uniref:arsenical pump-driving ATPase n=1 Tax=Latilactobacillus sakei TaxID=1599 RepID=UPI003F5323E1